MAKIASQAYDALDECSLRGRFLGGILNHRWRAFYVCLRSRAVLFTDCHEGLPAVCNMAGKSRHLRTFRTA
jgi:hypothetical protein